MITLLALALVSARSVDKKKESATIETGTSQNHGKRMPEIAKYYPDRIKDRRLEMGKTLKQCAAHLETSIGRYSLLEKGDCPFELNSLRKLASFLSTDALYFFYSSWPLEIAAHRSWLSTPKT